jgi:hypothetical protein
MSVDRAKFVVRHPGFAQTEGYADFAGNLVDFLVAETLAEPTAMFLTRVIGGAVAHENSDKKLNAGEAAEAFGILREDAAGGGTSAATTLGGVRYKDAFTARHKEKEGIDPDPEHLFSWPLEYKDEARGIDAELAMISNISDKIQESFGTALGTAYIVHPTPTGMNWEHIKAAVEWSFYDAKNEENTPEERKTAALETFSLMGHMMPLQRGSSIYMRVALEYMAETVGFETPYVKEGCDLCIEAVLRDPREFAKDYQTGMFFDKEGITGDEIMDWQRLEAKKQEMAKKDAEKQSTREV